MAEILPRTGNSPVCIVKFQHLDGNYAMMVFESERLAQDFIDNKLETYINWRPSEDDVRDMQTNEGAKRVYQRLYNREGTEI